MKYFPGVHTWSVAAAIKSFFFHFFLPSLSGMQNFGKIHIDRPIILLDIWIKNVIFPQIRVDTVFFPQKNFFDILSKDGGVGLKEGDFLL